MKRTIFTFFFLLAMANVYAYDIAVENADGVTIYYNYINDGQELEVTYKTDNLEDNAYTYVGRVVIPEVVTVMNRTLSVTRIGDHAFRYSASLDSVSLGSSLVEIGNYAFADSKIKDYFSAPHNLTTIGNHAFANCTDLRYLYIPDNVISIGDNAFTGCKRLSNVTIGDGVTAIGDETFMGCERLWELSIGDHVTSIGSHAFDGCRDLYSLTIPASVTSIGQGAFENCRIRLVTSLIMNPFAITGKWDDDRTFSVSTFDDATLYVPLGSIDKYKATAGWKDFARILTVHGLEYDYRPFIERAKVWRTGIPNPDGEGYSQLFHYIFCSYPPDTLINGQRCTLMGRCRLVDYGDGIYGELDTVYVGALYEKDRQVFCAYPGSQELVLHYDFASPVGSVVSIGGNELTIFSKESVQGENYKGESVYLQSEDHVVCWQEGIGNRFAPMENLHGLHPASASDEVLISCSVGDEVLYYNGSPFAGGNEVKKNTIDFTHVVKTKPKAPRRGAVSESEDDELLTGMYSLNNLFLNFKNLTGVFVVTIRNASGTEVYRKEVQTNNVVAINTVIGNYPKGMYTIMVENDEEAYTAALSIDDWTGIKPHPLIPSPKGEGEAGAWYDLSGRRIANNSSARQLVHSSTLPKGIYIRGGRKVVVK